MTRRIKENFNSRIIKASGVKPIAYNVMLSKLANCSPDAGLFLSQLLYWWGKGSRSDGTIYKTIADVKKETCLSRAKQDRAIRTWKKLKVITVEYHSIPRKRHFRIDVGRLIGMLERIKGEPIVLEKTGAVLDFSTLFCDFPQPITESTSRELLT